MPKKTKNKKNYYFTKIHEEAIVRYAITSDRAERTKLYIELIEPALSEMVDKIVYTYKHTSLPNIDELKQECKIWLTTILDKYDPNKGHMAFSYFSVITKNWFSHARKKNAIKAKREAQYEDVTKGCSDHMENENLVVYQPFLRDREDYEFWASFWDEYDSWGKETMKENKRKVYNAIRQLFESKNEIEIFNKKAIYLYLREITGLNTKQVVNNLKKFREDYFAWREKWNAGEIK